MEESPQNLKQQPKEIFTDKPRCAACGGKCCQIYRPISEGGTFPDGEDFATWCRDFHPNRDSYGIEPLFDPIEVFRGNNLPLRKTLTEKGINPECCEYIGRNGCLLSREKRPEQCLSYRCESWLAEEGEVINMERNKKMFFEYMKPGEEIKVASLVWKVFEEFEAPGYKQEGIDEFKTFTLPENIKVRCDTGQFFVICCKIIGEIIGVIAMRDNSHISLLFVKKEYHRKGIARKLFKIALEKCYNIDRNLQSITVNSSPYAVEIYEKLGFEKIDFEQERNGIRFTPMKFSIM